VKVTGAKTPEITVSSSESTVSKVEEGLIVPPNSTNERSKMKTDCLHRDDHRCLITRSVDLYWKRAHRDLYPQGTVVDNTECAHILPHALGSFDPDRAQEVENAAIIWAALYKYFPALVGQIAPDTINCSTNGITLTATLHEYFGDFELYFERMV
jgi:hypothetical protein